MNARASRTWVAALMVLGVLTGCATTYYSVWETLGYQKRDILKTRVERARDSQQQAFERFEAVAQASAPLASASDGAVDTARQLQSLRVAYRNAARTASTVRTHIDQVDDVSQALFVEWEEELINTASSTQRSNDHQELADTRQAYNGLMGAMRGAEAGITPVLNTVEDSMRGLEDVDGALTSTQVSGFLSLQGDLERLTAELRRSIDAATRFAERLER
ncbi:MAG: DUF2959 family protein [Pseudomonadota bacterium]